jgi:hypothetical protein
LELESAVLHGICLRTIIGIGKGEKE